MPPITIEERVRCSAATPQELSDLGPERVAEIKSDPDHTQYKGSGHVAVKVANAEDRKVLRLIASTDDQDHYGDRVSVRGTRGGKGWQLKAYEAQGGVYLWSHNLGSTKAPIGQALKTWTGKIGKAAEGMKAKGLDPDKMALMQDVEFLSADDGPDDHFKFSETVYLLMSGKGTRSGKGMMGSSVGFVPGKVFIPESKEQRESLGFGQWGVGHDEQTLLENSATPTPANPFASTIGQKSAAFKSIEQTVLEELQYMEDANIHDPKLLKLFRQRAILGPDDAEAKLTERLRSRVFMSLDGEADGSVTSTPSLEKEIESAFDEPTEVLAAETAPEVEEVETQEPDELKTLSDGIKTELDDQNETVMTLDADARTILERAYQAADFAMAALGSMCDAIDSKSITPDFESSFGGNSVNEEIKARLDNIEASLQSFSDSGAKVTARTERDPIDTDSLSQDISKAIAAAVKGI